MSGTRISLEALDEISKHRPLTDAEIDRVLAQIRQRRMRAAKKADRS